MKKISFLMLFILSFALCFLGACSRGSGTGTGTGTGNETTYTVTFNSALGTNVEAQTVKANETAVKPADPTRDGYVFEYWTLSGAEYDFSTPVTANITLTAKWAQEQVFTVTFKDASGNTLEVQQVKPGESATAPATNPTKAGYVFKGWDKDFTNVQSDLVVSPKFEKEQEEEVFYTVVFKIFGEVYYTNNMVFEGDPVTPPLEKNIDGYEFVGWDNEEEYVYSDMVVNAIYEAIEYSLEFYLGANKFENFTTTYNIEEGATLPTISGHGYTFEGWYDLEDVKVTTLVGEYGNKVLYAKISGDISEVTVDPTNSAVFGDPITVNGKTYTMGIGVAASLAQAAATPYTNSLTINLPAGTYADEVAITGNNVTILGPNAEVDPTDPDATRNAEAVITGLITIAPEVDNITFLGLKFAGDGQIVGEAYDAGTDANNPVNNHENLLFKYNIVESSLNKDQGSGFIVLIEAANSYGKNLQIINNKFSYAITETSMMSMVYTDNVEDVVITGNIFKNIPVDAIWFNDTSKGLSGLNNKINNNTFENIGKSGIKIDWADPHIGSTTSKYEVNGNSFKNVGTTEEDYGIKYGPMNFSSVVESVVISYNKFDGGSNYISVQRCKTDGPVTLTANEFVSNPSYVKEGATVNGYVIRVINERFDGSPNEKLTNAIATGSVFGFSYQQSQLLNVTLQ